MSFHGSVSLLCTPEAEKKIIRNLTIQSLTRLTAEVTFRFIWLQIWQCLFNPFNNSKMIKVTRTRQSSTSTFHSTSLSTSIPAMQSQMVQPNQHCFPYSTCNELEIAAAVFYHFTRNKERKSLIQFTGNPLCSTLQKKAPLKYTLQLHKTIQS